MLFISLFLTPQTSKLVIRVIGRVAKLGASDPMLIRYTNEKQKTFPKEESTRYYMEYTVILSATKFSALSHVTLTSTTTEFNIKIQ